MTLGELKERLNEKQYEAVTHPGGPLLVFAGAGSGKTRVITYRVAWLIQQGIPPHRILAVTFTNKAAEEMRTRVEELVGERAKGIWMGTFHRICGRILRQYGHSIGLERNFVIYDESDQISLIRGILKQQNWDEKSITPRNILNEISRAKERLISPERFSALATGFIERIAAEIYPLYQEQLRKNKALDFDDMIYYTVRLLKEREEIRKELQERFLHVLVDEFQDVNLSQYELVKILCGKHKNILIVGDDDQSIYAWRGADVSLILKFSNEYENAKILMLEQNYRSTQRILQSANEVIKSNRKRAPKKLWTENEPGPPITITEVGTEQDEAMLVADTILQGVHTGKRRFSDFAVLYRTNAQSRVLEETFLMMRIPHLLIGGQRFYERKEIKDMVAYLRVVANPYDDISLKRVINVPMRGIGENTIQKIESKAAGKPLWTVITDNEFLLLLQPRIRHAISQFVKIIEHAAPLVEKGFTEPILRTLLQTTGYLDALRSENTEEAQSRLENLQELVNVAAQHDANADEPGLHSFLHEISLLTDADEIKQGAEAVTLMTVHTAKGLEFPVVFIVGLEEGIFPHARSMDTDSELEEERRLCYVAMTRAREELHLLHAARRSTYGQPSFNAPSRFLASIPRECVSSLREPIPSILQDRRPSREWAMMSTDSTASRPLRGPEWTAPFQVGQQVRHPKFGVGIVISCIPVKDDCEVTVSFPGVIGVKRLMQNIAKLEPG
ncbi:MAG TPA: UvrD-helicase domain-containing protein [Fimbriimonadales bacterium]|nr:UvrD-helicase domain-containing protein [Fimbriimonadales bacterium]